MIRIEFSEQDWKTIQQLRYAHLHPRVRRRMEVLWLKSQGIAQREICRFAGISGNTLRQYLGVFQSGGIKKLTELNVYAPTSELEQDRDRLEAHFRVHPPATINEAAAKVRELTGIKRSPSAVGRFLNSLAYGSETSRNQTLESRPGGARAFSYQRVGAAHQRNQTGQTRSFLSMLVTSYWCLSRYSVVVLRSLCQDFRSENTFQRARCAERDHT
jgi:transposase